MEQERIVVIFHNHRTGQKLDLELPTDISANELIIGLSQGFRLDMDITNLSACFLRTENPIAFLKGSKTLGEYGLHNGTVINYL